MKFSDKLMRRLEQARVGDVGRLGEVCKDLLKEDASGLRCCMFFTDADLSLSLVIQTFLKNWNSENFPRDWNEKNTTTSFGDLSSSDAAFGWEWQDWANANKAGTSSGRGRPVRSKKCRFFWESEGSGVWFLLLRHPAAAAPCLGWLLGQNESLDFALNQQQSTLGQTQLYSSTRETQRSLFLRRGLMEYLLLIARSLEDQVSKASIHSSYSKSTPRTSKEQL